MSYYVYKPHVVGPEGQITTPDVIVDRVFVEGKPRSVGVVTSDLWQQVDAGETASAAYAVMALGGGALISPALVLSSGGVVIARKAWRLNNLDGHIGDVTLNGKTLSDIGLPIDLIEASGGKDDALPRGYLLLQTVAGDTRTADLADPKLSRSLSHKVVFEPLNEDRWGDARPRPRYSIGPTQKEITHYI